MIVRRANLGDISALVFLLNRMHKETTSEIPKINTAKLVDKINQLLHTGVVLVGIDDNNNIIINKEFYIKDIMNKEKIQCKIGEKTFEIENKKIQLCEKQRVILYNKGISKIDCNHILDNTRRGNIILNITLKI